MATDGRDILLLCIGVNVRVGLVRKDLGRLAFGSIDISNLSNAFVQSVLKVVFNRLIIFGFVRVGRF